MMPLYVCYTHAPAHTHTQSCNLIRVPRCTHDAKMCFTINHIIFLTVYLHHVFYTVSTSLVRKLSHEFYSSNIRYIDFVSIHTQLVSRCSTDGGFIVCVHLPPALPMNTLFSFRRCRVCHLKCMLTVE